MIGLQESGQKTRTVGRTNRRMDGHSHFYICEPLAADKNFVFQARVFKISEKVGHVGRKSDQSPKFGFGAPFES